MFFENYDYSVECSKKKILSFYRILTSDFLSSISKKQTKIKKINKYKMPKE